MRILTVLFALAAAPVAAAEGVLVWHDDADMAVKLAVLQGDDPRHVTALHVLAETQTISATMTAVSADGQAVGLCHQVQDDNESPASLRGYDLQGREIWKRFPSEIHAQIEAGLPEGVELASSSDRLTFSCEDGGASGAPGGLAFDVGVSAGPRGADGFVSDYKTWRIRLHLDGASGALLAAEPVRKGGLVMVRPNRDRLARTPDGSAVVMEGRGSVLVLPEGGTGRVLWGEQAIRWQGKPVGEGHDFAWFIPPRD